MQIKKERPGARVSMKAVELVFWVRAQTRKENRVSSLVCLGFFIIILTLELDVYLMSGTLNSPD